MQMWMTHGEEDGTYEQRHKTKRLSGRLETITCAAAGITSATAGMPAVTAGSEVAESFDKTVHCL
jgi:hypothetical protein